MSGERAANVEFMDLVRSVIGLEPIPGSPCSRNAANRDDEIKRLGGALMLTGVGADEALRALDGEPELSSGACVDDLSS